MQYLSKINFEKLVHKTNDAFLILDRLNSVVMDVNEAYCNAIGFDSDEIIGRPLSDFIALEDRVIFLNSIKDTTRQNSLSMSTIHVSKNGSNVHFDCTIVFEQIDDTPCAICFLRDVSARVKREKRRQKTNQICMQFADNVDDVFWVKEHDKILFVNQAYERVWGYDRNELYRDSNLLLEAVVAEDRNKLEAAFQSEMYDNKHTLNEVFRIKVCSNEIRWVYVRSFPIYDKNGVYIKSATIAKDITAEMKLTSDLRSMNDKLAIMVKEEVQMRMEKELAFSSIFEIMGTSVCIVSESGILLDVNRQFLKVSDAIAKEDIIGNHIFTLLDEKKREQAEIAFEEIKEKTKIQNCFCDPNDTDVCCRKTTIEPYEWHTTTANGKELILLANSACFKNHSGEVNFVFSMIDITPMRELVAKQAENERLLLQQGKLAAMGEMIGAIAHQWRQPLNLLGLIIQDIAYIYKQNELSDEYVTKFSSEAMSQVNLMSKTIDDFRNFFRSDKKCRVFSLNVQVKKSLDLVKAMFKSHGIKVDYSDSGDVSVIGYPNELIQAILNILNNAKDAFNSSGISREPSLSITISKRSDEGYGAITIKDNAGGIPSGIIDRIFEPYFTTKAPDKGTGIGLFMSKIIVETNMNGYLNVYNDSDGAVFTIKIPLSRNDE